MTDPQHQSQTPLSSQEGLQGLDEQDLEMITGAGNPTGAVTHNEYANIYNSVRTDLRVPLLSKNQSEAIRVSENFIKNERQKGHYEGYLHPLGGDDIGGKTYVLPHPDTEFQVPTKE